MFATELYADEWKGAYDEGSEYYNPNEDVIIAALRKLDGRSRTLVMLRDNGEANLVVGGGEYGRYVVYGTFGNQSFQVLTRHADSDLMVTVNAGGQTGEYPERWVVGLGEATQAALAFAVNGILDRSLTWELRT